MQSVASVDRHPVGLLKFPRAISPATDTANEPTIRSEPRYLGSESVKDQNLPVPGYRDISYETERFRHRRAGANDERWARAIHGLSLRR
jgi:hypothetical protein